jgi:hypothetical protein
MWSEDEEEAAVPAADPNLQLTLDLGPGKPQPLSPSNHKSPSSGRLGGLNRFGTSWAPQCQHRCLHLKKKLQIHQHGW